MFFYRPELGLVVEALGKDGELVDSFDGRKLNPGHAIESTWFIMDLGKRLNRPDLIEKAVEISLAEVEYGWDEQYGGIFYFMDRLGKPRHELEFDQKTMVGTYRNAHLHAQRVSAHGQP